jgi:hypothetical protein
MVLFNLRFVRGYSTSVLSQLAKFSAIICCHFHYNIVAWLKPLTLGLWGGCSTNVPLQLAEFSTIVFLCSSAGLIPSTLGLWGECSNTVLSPLAKFYTIVFCHFHYNGVGSTTVLSAMGHFLMIVFLPYSQWRCCWTKTLNLRIIRPVVYNCALATGKFFCNGILPFSLPWCRWTQVKWSTTMLSLLAKFCDIVFLLISLP